MRLIDADELRKCAIPCEIHKGASTDLCVPLYQIDNAPSVELDESVIQEVLNKRCMTAVANEYLVALRCNGTRPQGDWRDNLIEVFRQSAEVGGDTFHLFETERIINGEPI